MWWDEEMEKGMNGERRWVGGVLFFSGGRRIVNCKLVIMASRQ